MIEKAKQGGKEEDNKNEWEKVTITRRRQLKVKPNLENAKKRQTIKEKLKEKGIKRRDYGVNSFEVLMELEKVDECIE